MEEQYKKMKDLSIRSIKQVSTSSRLTLLKMAERCNASIHWGGSFSCIEILAVLYGKILRKDDHFILSKGHAAPALYAVLYQYGFLTEEELNSYREDNTEFGELLEANDRYGFECSGGSLGLGLSYGCGIALREKINNTDSKVFVLVGDGELDEGSVWESIMFASKNELNNLILIIDANELQLDGFTKDIIPWTKLKENLQSFNWNVLENNGNSCDDVYATLCLSFNDFPTAIILHTVKGKGVSFMENNYIWHDSTLSHDLLLQAYEEIRNAEQFEEEY